METQPSLLEEQERTERALADDSMAMPETHQDIGRYRGLSLEELKDIDCPYIVTLIMQNSVEEVAAEKVAETIDKIEAGKKLLAENPSSIFSLFAGMPGVQKPETISDAPAKEVAVEKTVVPPENTQDRILHESTVETSVERLKLISEQPQQTPTVETTIAPLPLETREVSVISRDTTHEVAMQVIMQEKPSNEVSIQLTELSNVQLQTPAKQSPSDEIVTQIIRSEDLRAAESSALLDEVPAKVFMDRQEYQGMEDAYTDKTSEIPEISPPALAIDNKEAVDFSLFTPELLEAPREAVPDTGAYEETIATYEILDSLATLELLPVTETPVTNIEEQASFSMPIFYEEIEASPVLDIEQSNTEASKAIIVPELQQLFSYFEEPIATPPTSVEIASAAEPTFDELVQVKEQVNEQPLETTLLHIIQILRPAPLKTASAEISEASVSEDPIINTFETVPAIESELRVELQEALNELHVAIQKSAVKQEISTEEVPAITPEVTEKMLAVLKIIGYEEPAKALVAFAEKYGTQNLVRVFQQLSLMVYDADHKEILSANALASLSATVDDSSHRIGSALLWLVHRLQPTAGVAIS